MARRKPVDPFLALPKRVRGVIEACRGGETLCRHFRTLRHDGEAQDFFLEPSGRSVGIVTAQTAIGSPFMAANADGLFPGDAQTFVAVQP